MRVTRGLMVALAVASVCVTAACTDEAAQPAPPTPATSAATAPVELTFGIVGPAPVRRALAATVDAWNAGPDAEPEAEATASDDVSATPVPRAHVEIQAWRDLSSFRADIERGEPLPDVFLAARSELAWLLENEYVQPVNELLDDRGVEFGDAYSRDAIEALSANDHLQCMPYGVSPTVIYYNKRLVNFERMRNRDLDAPGPDATSWSFDQFAAAAEFASRPARGTKGVHIEPTIEGLTPFINSGGGTVFDEAEEPTSLTFASDGTKGALERTLQLLRNPQVTPDEAELAQAPALRRFVRGKLGMIAGDRSLTPLLRTFPKLDFDILSMPRLDGSASVGDVAALCMSATTAEPGLAADFMVHEISRESVAEVARTGYLQPANVEVALSEDFLQSGLRPANAEVFNSAVRSMSVPPLIDTLPELEAAVAPAVQQLIYGVGVLDLDEVTTQIDEESRTVLDPDSASESPEASESASP